MAKTTYGNLHWADILVIVAYFVVVLAVGLVVGASLFASNIGSGHFVGLAGSGAAGGIAVAGFEINAAFVLVILGWLFVPVYIASGVYTMPEYMRKRFGGQRIRVYLSVLALLLYIFSKISADLFAGAIFINQSLNWSLYPSIGLLLIVACIFTVMGGLTAVIWTDTIQVAIMLIGAFVLTIMSFHKVGGYHSMVEKYFLAVPPSNYTLNSTQCAGLPRQDSMHLFRNAITGDLPWPGMTFGLTVIAVWYWCSDQVIVQRALAAKDYSHAKGGCVLAALLKFLPLWLMVFPGLRGLMLSVMLSALMSSLTSIFNSSSTIFTMDIWKLFRTHCSDMELLIVGRLFVVFLVAVGILWIPVIQNFPGSQLFTYIQTVQSCLAPPICAVYCLAIFWPRTNEPGAFWGLVMGLVVGLGRFILDVASAGLKGTCAEPDSRTLLLTSVHYMHFSIILFGLTVIVTVVTSLLTPPIDEKHLYRLTFWSRFSKEDRIAMNEEKEAIRRAKQRQVEIERHATEAGRTHISWCRKIINFTFGLDDTPKELSQAEREQLDKNMISLDEGKKTAILWNVSAVAVLALAVFIYAFYG